MGWMAAIARYLLYCVLMLLCAAEPVFTVRPSAARVGLNGIAKFDCVAQGNPPPSVFWAKEVSTVETNISTHLNNFAMASSSHHCMYCMEEKRYSLSDIYLFLLGLHYTCHKYVMEIMCLC